MSMNQASGQVFGVDFWGIRNKLWVVSTAANLLPRVHHRNP